MRIGAFSRVAGAEGLEGGASRHQCHMKSSGYRGHIVYAGVAGTPTQSYVT